MYSFNSATPKGGVETSLRHARAQRAGKGLHLVHTQGRRGNPGVIPGTCWRIACFNSATPKGGVETHVRGYGHDQAWDASIRPRPRAAWKLASISLRSA